MAKNSDYEHFGQYIAHNMKLLRKNLNLSQEQLSERSGVPRSTIASLERGEANPTLAVLIGVAQGLKASLAELLEKPSPKTILYKNENYKKIQKFLLEGNVTTLKTTDILLLTPENSRYLVLQKYSLQENERFAGSPHPPGTEEYFYCMTGRFRIQVEDIYYTVEAGNLLCFDGHLRHYYAGMQGFKQSTGLSIVVQIPRV